MNSSTRSFILITIIIGLATACNSNIFSRYKAEKGNDTVPTTTKPPCTHNANEQEQTFETYEKVFFEYDSVKYKDIASTVINPHNIFYVSDLDQNFEIKEKQNFDVEPLGYRGRNYQRFYIHFDTVYKSSANTYLAQGRTRYRDTIRTFEGIITLDSASTAYYTNLSRTYGVSHSNSSREKPTPLIQNGIPDNRSNIKYRASKLYYRKGYSPSFGDAL